MTSRDLTPAERDYLATRAADTLILCPWCGDWEDLEDVEEQLATGRFWCCGMCDMCPDRRWPRLLRTE